MNLLFKKQKNGQQASFINEEIGKSTYINIDSNSELSKQIKIINLQKEDLVMLASLKPIIQANIEGIVSQFYKNLEHEGSLMNIIEDNSSVERLKQTLMVHIQEMFDGRIDQLFIDKRMKIAHIHFKIGLLPKWYMCAFQDLLLSLIALINKHIHQQEESTKAMEAITKILSLEQQLVLDAFQQENEQMYKKTGAGKRQAAPSN
nr:protoglobin domain-containing protein [Sediminibacillus albus]